LETVVSKLISSWNSMRECRKKDTDERLEGGTTIL